MDIQEVVRQAQDTMTVRRVTGEPYEKNGITLISVVAIRGGWGAGAGTGAEGAGEGGGGGFGMVARPVGAYVIRGEQVTWQPALDVNRIIMGGQLVAIVALLTVRTVVRARSRRAFLRRALRRRRQG
ncbi:MAG: sporulation protein [Chloroflexi bacterium]|nr:MAG: sporulation protein [Chloroflexota bacterium]